MPPCRRLSCASRFGSLLALALLSLLALASPGASTQKDKEVQLKIALDELKNEVIVLERQVRSMQETLDRNSGQMNTLVTQIIDNVTAIRQAQSRVAEGRQTRSTKSAAWANVSLRPTRG